MYQFKVQIWIDRYMVDEVYFYTYREAERYCSTIEEPEECYILKVER